jgi:dihydrofolate reductase
MFMFFQKGDWLEVSGRKTYEVLYADEDFFIGRTVYFLTTNEPSQSTEVFMYSNKNENYEGAYWIKRIQPDPMIKKALYFPILQ